MEGAAAEDIKVYSSKDTKCPSCGGKLVFDPVQQMLKCDFCGNTYTPEKIELLEQLPEIDTGAADEKEADKCEIVCDNCGAVLITDNNTVATSCSFCGSPAIVTRRLSKQFRPDYLIPFKITKEEAQEKFVEFAKAKKYVPNDYFDKSNLNKIQGIYVPFWIMSSRCQVSARGDGIKQRAVYKDKYALMSDFDIKYNNVPFDGSLEIADGLMEAIEPFDISQRIAFTSSYLQGFYAQKFNLTTDNLCDRIIARMQQYGKETAAMSFSGFDSVKFAACGVRPYDLESTYALYPVWFLNYKYDDQNYMIAVNGQTGKTDGYLPVDKAKRRARLVRHRIVDALLVALVVAIVGGLLAALFFAGLHFIKSGAGLVFLIAVVVFASPIGLMTFMGYRFKLASAEKAETFIEFLTRPITKLSAKRHDSYIDLLNETNMVVGPRPSADTYYDSKAKIDFKNSEVFSNSEM